MLRQNVQVIYTIKNSIHLSLCSSETVWICTRTHVMQLQKKSIRRSHFSLFKIQKLCAPRTVCWRRSHEMPSASLIAATAFVFQRLYVALVSCNTAPPRDNQRDWERERERERELEEPIMVNMLALLRSVALTRTSCVHYYTWLVWFRVH
jgi:hypothetical protein